MSEGDRESPMPEIIAMPSCLDDSQSEEELSAADTPSRLRTRLQNCERAGRLLYGGECDSELSGDSAELEKLDAHSQS